MQGDCAAGIMAYDISNGVVFAIGYLFRLFEIERIGTIFKSLAIMHKRLFKIENLLFQALWAHCIVLRDLITIYTFII